MEEKAPRSSFELTSLSTGEKKSSGCVLIADDEDALRELLGAFLSKLGYETRMAVDGQEALKALRSGGIDVVVSDYSMPLLNGLQLHDRIREETPHLADRFILITGTTFTSEVTRFIQTHDASFLQKPFSLPDLADMIEKALQEETPSSAPAMG